MTSQNDHQTQILSGQIVILAGHCPVTGTYFEPCSINNKTIRCFELNDVKSEFCSDSGMLTSDLKTSQPFGGLNRVPLNTRNMSSNESHYVIFNSCVFFLLDTIRHWNARCFVITCQPTDT